MIILSCGVKNLDHSKMAKFVMQLVVFLSVLLCGLEGAKILAVLPTPSFSHFILGFRIAEELAARGHQVTVINPYPQKTPIENYRDVSVEELITFIQEHSKRLFTIGKLNHLQHSLVLSHMGTGLTEKTLSNKNVQELLKSEQSFDLVLIEHFFNDALVGLGYYFKAPVVLLSSHGTGILCNYIVANPSPASYVPNLLGTLTRHMNFWQRFENLYLNLINDVTREFVFLPNQRKVFKKYISQDLELDEVLYNTSLILLNSHVSVKGPVPHVPSMVEIGGFHVYPPRKLPEDLKQFLDASEEGVILFSMGSNLNSKDLKPEVRDAFLGAFSKIKQTVLWKFETDIPDQPNNLKIMKWLPQQDVLAHPNVKAFISHGGMLSLIEAVYFGVPIVGIPVFGDQITNVAGAVSSGYAVAVPLVELSEEQLSRALKEILHNPKYRENVKRRSAVMREQPVAPIDSSIFWIEHVIRHGGGAHLRSSGLDLQWYQRDMVDIIVFLTIVTVVLFVLFYILIRRLIKLVSKRKPESYISKKNK